MTRAWTLGLGITVVAIVACPGVALAAGAGAETLETYHGWGLFLLFGTAFATGVGASLTPCVYPMIPIVLGVFGARGKNVSRRKSFALATLYVLGMGTTYATLGTIFTMLGKQFSTVLAEPAVVIPIVSLYVLLALAMFGAFELNLPASWQERLNRVGGAGYRGAFAMGMVGGFTAAPCTGPFIGGLLAAVAQTGDIPLGASVLFVHALGIGVLYWVLAVFASSLPKSGVWMEWFKSIGGIGLLVAAVWFLEPIFPALSELASPSVPFLVGAIVLVVVGLGLGAVHLSFHDRTAIKLRKGAAVALVVAGAYGIIAWAFTPDRRLPWAATEAIAFDQARAEGKGVMVDFSATWCKPCKELEITFADRPVFDMITQNFVPLRFDVSKDNAANAAVQHRYGVNGSLPNVLFVAEDGTVLARITQNTRDYLKPSGFLRVMEPAAAEIARRRGSN